MARALIVLLGLYAAAGLAQPLPDPTRPPSFVEPMSGGMAAAAPTSALQSVILRDGAKPRALLGGEWIELGQEYAGARLIKVTESSVVLSGPSGRETLYLTPDAEIKPIKPVSMRQRGGEARGKK